MVRFGEIIADKSYIFHKPYKKTGQNCGQFVLRIWDVSKIMGYEDINKWTNLRVMNTYSVIVLGPRGSGKTVLLASLYKKLSVQGKLGFFLKVERGRQRKILTRAYKDVAVGEQWPDATQFDELSEWEFTCCVQTKDLSIYPACKFVYLDYAGGRLTNPDEMLEEEEEFEEGEEFDNKLKTADIMLGLLDGQKLCSLMRNEPGSLNWVLEDLANMLGVMQDLGNKPLHFVISKWDIVEPNYSLREIRDRLLEIEEFTDLARARIQGETPVRLIPVSSVGKGFATLQADGTMAKKTGLSPKPFQVETPLACVLPDSVKVKLQELKKKRQAEASRNVEVKPELDILEKGGELFGGILQGLFPSSTGVVKDLVDFVEQPAREKQKNALIRTEELRAKQAESIKKIVDEETALEYAIRCFMSIQERLEEDFQESDLRKVLL